MTTASEAGCWTRLRAAVGPAAAGLIGGGLSGLAAVPALAPLIRNVGATYAQYPSLHHDWPAVDPSDWVCVFAVLVGLAAPVAVGAVAVWAARPRDAWADFAAGLSAALAATLAALVTCVGWPVVLALVVVPSIPDLTLLGDSVKAPAAGAAAHPSQPLANRYPDLEGIEPERRGTTHMAKIVSDQVAGGMYAVWIGVLVSMLTAGTLAMCGTMAAGYLTRRGDRLRRTVVPYLEVTLPLTASAGLLAGAALSPVWDSLLGHNPFGIGPLALAGTVCLSALMLAGVVHRWPWLLRLCLGLTWVMLLAQGGRSHVPWPLPLFASILTGVLLVRYRVMRLQAVAVSPG